MARPHAYGTRSVTLRPADRTPGGYLRCGRAKPPKGDPPSGLAGFSAVVNVRAKRTSCKRARRIASAFTHRRVERPERFRCVATNGEGFSDIRCTLGPRIVLYRSVVF